MTHGLMLQFPGVVAYRSTVCHSIVSCVTDFCLCLQLDYNTVLIRTTRGVRRSLGTRVGVSCRGFIRSVVLLCLITQCTVFPPTHATASTLFVCTSYSRVLFSPLGSSYVNKQTSTLPTKIIKSYVQRISWFWCYQLALEFIRLSPVNKKL